MRKIELPVMAEIEIDLSVAKDSADVDKVENYLKTELAKLQPKEWPGVNIKVSRDDNVLNVLFDGKCEYSYFPGTPRTWNDPGDPDDIDGYFETEDVVDYIRDLILKAPFDVELTGALAKDFKDQDFIQHGIYANDSDIPSWDDIEAAFYSEEEPYDDGDMAYEIWKDRQFENESILNSVLAGKSLTEAILAERENGDWDITSDEAYKPDDKDVFYSEYNKEKAAAIVKINKFATAVRELNEAFKFCNDYNIPYYDVPGCPFENMASMVHDCDAWTRKLFDLIDNADPVGGND